MFAFYKYIKPSWYYFLSPFNLNIIYFPNIDTLPQEYKKIVKLDYNYKTEAAIKWDAAFQLFQKGFIDQYSRVEPLEEKVTSLMDNYLFIRKYFKPLWSWFVLMCRLFSFNNPYAELKAFVNAFKIKRINAFENFIIYSDFDSIGFFDDMKSGKISIIIATLNRYEYLLKVLKAIEVQTVPVNEVIVVDQSENFNRNFYAQFNLPFKIIRQDKRGQWTARNAALKVAKGKLIAFCDDDIEIGNDWVENHLKVLNYFTADISTGVFYFKKSGIPPEKINFKYAEQFSSNNSMIKRKVLHKIGLFDKQFDGLRWGDGELGLRAYLYGFKSISNPKASCIDLKAHNGGLREGGSWDAYKPAKFWGIRPVPSVFYFYLKYFPVSHLYADLLVKLPLSFASARKENSFIEKLFSVLVFIFMTPFLTFSVIRSWKKGSGMLKSGAEIDKLE